MGPRKFWFLVLAVAFAALTVPSAKASSYVRGYVKPSGDGDNCSVVTPGTNCVGGSGSVLEFNNGTLSAPDVYNLFEIGVTQGATVTFIFSGVPGATDFQVVACGYGNSGELGPGIYTSSEVNLNLPCTALGDPNNSAVFMNPSNFINDDDCTGNTVCYTFSGAGLPFTWVFSEISTGPSVLSITETFAPVAAPEPASLSLLAAGLVGLGIFRRKRPA